MTKSTLEARYTKSNLPTKICEQCKRPMEWRKSWAKNWEEVKYCSDRCRREVKRGKLEMKRLDGGEKRGENDDDSIMKKIFGT